MSELMDVIILAGGRGSRMGGVDKSTVRLGGRRMIDIVLENVAALEPHSVLVVSTREPSLPPGVKLVSEVPPFAGPLAAIAAGVKALEPGAKYTLILPVDAPRAALGASQLHEHLLAARADAAAAVVESKLTLVNSLWATASLQPALTAIGAVENVPVSALAQHAEIVEVELSELARDADTMEDLKFLG